MKLRVLIAEDEAPARERLVRQLLHIQDVELVGQAANGQEAVRLTKKTQPDLVLLDIRMPGTDGMEAAAEIRELTPKPKVIFITAYGEHALKAFEVEAVDYLVKPVRSERLAEALERVRTLIGAAAEEAEVEIAGSDFIVAQRQGSVQRIPLDEVCFFRADSKYVVAKLKRGEVLLEKPLKELEDEFEGRFVRVHRNALASLALMEAMERAPGGGYRLRLKGVDERLEISRRHVTEIRAIIKGELE